MTTHPFPDDICVALVACLDPEGRADDHTGDRDQATHAKLLIDKLASIVWESAPDGIVETDSPTWRAFTGQSYDDWKVYGWLTAIHPDDRLVTMEQWRNTVQDERAVKAEYRLRKQDGQYRRMRVHAVPSRDAHGQIMRWFGINIELPDHFDLPEIAAERAVPKSRPQQQNAILANSDDDAVTR